MYIAVDFDGTCVTHEFPNVGEDIPLAKETLKELSDNGHKIILCTMRSHKPCGGVKDPLQDALNWFRDNGIPLYDINRNKDQYSWTDSPKIYAHIYIDDAALGCPLTYSNPHGHERAHVDWSKVRQRLGLL